MSAKRRTVPFEEGFLDLLPDSVVEEILLRLPLSAVFRTRCVSKQLLSLTTLPSFIRRWELHHATLSHDPPLPLLLQNFFNITTKDFLRYSGEPDVKLSGFSLDFVPGFLLNDDNPITVVGCCDDLLLCCNKYCFPSDYFVVNPITCQWLALPPTLRLYEKVLVGLVCEPGSVARARKGGELRYRVVRISIFEDSEFGTIVEIFSSENGQWNEYVMTIPKELGPALLDKSCVAWSGIMYWKADGGDVKVMGLDPFNPEEKGIFVIQNTPDVPDMRAKKYVLGICGDKLKMSQMLWSTEVDNEALLVNIWELENVEAKWRLVKVLPLREILTEILTANLSNVDLALNELIRCSPLAFHHSNKDIIYLECSTKVICCNLKMRSLKIMCDYDLNEGDDRCAEFFPFELPWWPTPIPALPQQCA